MGILDFLNRLLPIKGGKGSYDYEFNILDPPKDDHYTLLIKNSMPKSYWMQVIGAMNRITTKKIDMMNEFEVPQILKNGMMGRLKSVVDKIVKDLRKDESVKNLMLLNLNCDSMKFKVEGDMVRTEISCSGLCSV